MIIIVPYATCACVKDAELFKCRAAIKCCRMAVWMNSSWCVCFRNHPLNKKIAPFISALHSRQFEAHTAMFSYSYIVHVPLRHACYVIIRSMA